MPVAVLAMASAADTFRASLKKKKFLVQNAHGSCNVPSCGL